MSEGENLFQDRAAYFLAIEVGNYRAATRFALNRMRGDPGEIWAYRLRESLRRRHRSVRRKR